jgi:acetate kinase
MRCLTLNPGSSSLKVAMVEDGVVTESRAWATAGAESTAGAVSTALGHWTDPDVVGIRFVHGGQRASSIPLTTTILQELNDLTPLAPLHQPLSVRAAQQARDRLPRVPIVACFDTAFHARLPKAAATYPLPQRLSRNPALRKYGFHGLSCAYSLRRCASLLQRPESELNLLCCHIGGGVSVTAIAGGRSVDTSMGFTPLEGAMMATRSGSVDPGILLHLLSSGIVDVDALSKMLYRESGLAGMTGTSGDLRQILSPRSEVDPDQAELALATYLHRLRREIGAAAASLDRLDAVVFTGGVSEHEPELIGQLVAGLGVLGLTGKPESLREPGDREISPLGAQIKMFIVTAREELELARQAVLATDMPV